MASVTTTRFDSAGMVRLAVDFSSYGTIPTSVTLTRYAADGTAYTVRGADVTTGGTSGLLAAGIGQFDDYEAPLDLDFYYLAHPNTGADITTGTLNVSSSAAFGVPTGWLKDPARPGSAVPVMFTGTLEVTRPARQGLFDIVNKATPAAVSGVRGSPRFSATFCTLNPASIPDMIGVVSTGTVLLLQAPGGYVLGNWYVAVGDVVESRATRILRDSTRYWAMPFTVVDRPTTTSMAFSNAFSDAQVAYPLFSNMATVTFLTVLQGQDPNAVGSQTFVNPIYGGTVL